jgi:hypothetical protein
MPNASPRTNIRLVFRQQGKLANGAHNVLYVAKVLRWMRAAQRVAITASGLVKHIIIFCEQVSAPRMGP